MSDQNQDLNMQDLQAKIEEIKQSLKQVEDMESRQQGLRLRRAQRRRSRRRRGSG